MPYLLLLLLVALPIMAQQPQVIAGKSGIEAIDTLPTYEWDIATKNQSLPQTLLWGALLPGGSQFYTQHYVRGGFLAGMELALAFEVFYNKPLQQKQRLEESKLSRDSASYYSALLIQHGGYQATWDARRRYFLERARSINDIKLIEEDLRRSEMAWMFGLHLYGLMDGYGIWKHNQGRSTEQRSVESALWRALLVPGWGQIYNEEYGKAGLLYMSILGGVVSYQSRQGMVDHFRNRVQTAQAEGNGSLATLLEEDLLFFRKKRNQYVWGMTLFYLYSIADATVDAALSDFDSPNFWALIPYWGRDLGLQVSYQFNF